MVKDIMGIPAKGAWHCYVHKLRAWVAGDDGLPVRPYLMLVVSVEDGKFLACEAGNTPDEAMGGNVVKTEPTSETVLHFLKRVMTHPRQMNSSAAGEKLAPSRPKSINPRTPRPPRCTFVTRRSGPTRPPAPTSRDAARVSRRSVSMSAPSHPYPQRSSLT